MEALIQVRQRWESISRRAQWGTPVFEWMSSCLLLSRVMSSSCWCSSGLLKACAWSGFSDVHKYLFLDFGWTSDLAQNSATCGRHQFHQVACCSSSSSDNIQRGLVEEKEVVPRNETETFGLWASRQASYPDYSVDSAKIEKFYYCVWTFKFVCVLSIIQVLHFTQVQLNYGPTVSALSVGPEYLLYCYLCITSNSRLL